ncbi:hypothetical protein BMS3Abin09_00319 [bacterium BMS3Abin09]|nr:hypothetical protein BMS3Abin09_00319 [bacterium BMS3Abin09]
MIEATIRLKAMRLLERSISRISLSMPIGSILKLSSSFRVFFNSLFSCIGVLTSIPLISAILFFALSKTFSGLIRSFTSLAA